MHQVDTLRMQKPTDNNNKSVFLNLFLFNFLYLGLILIDRQLIKQGLLDVQLPIKLDLLTTLAGFIIGSGLIIILSAILIKKQHYLRILLVSIFVLGAIVINRHINKNIFFPPYTTYVYGDLDALGNKEWSHDYSYAMYSTSFEKYYLQTVVINPGIENLDEFKRLERFGFHVIESTGVPVSLNSIQFAQLEETYGNDYLLIKEDGFEYRFYDVNPNEEILLSLHHDMILFVPAVLFLE